MTKFKAQSKSKLKMTNIRIFVVPFSICVLALFCHLCFGICNFSFAQQGDLEYNLDVSSNTTPLPRIFRPNIDLSGRGLNSKISWPQQLAAKEVLDTWQKDIGFNNLYRIQYNLWEIHQLSKARDAQNKLLGNYENIIKNISDAGGIVILDIFGTPAGLGRVLDTKSPPWDLKAFKELVKSVMRYLSCNKRYNIWYELWSAPDLESFFLGRQQEYFNLYRVVAEAAKELEKETKVHIPLGGPSVSWWFQNLEGNTIFTPEESLIYEFIKFCYHYHLPLDFITWHGYSTSPYAEKENTIYKKTAVALIRDWLTYFGFARDTQLIIDEWNYDRDANVLPERQERSFVSASYIPSRIKNMYEAGIDCQLYFCLEDFQNNKEGVVRNVGIFSYDPESSEYKGTPKATYNAFRMLANLGSNMFLQKLDDEFVGIIATKGEDYFVILVYNYVDPEITLNFFSKNISTLNKSDRKALLGIIKSDKLKRILSSQLDISKLRESNKVKVLLKKAKELRESAKKFETETRNLKLGIKNLKENYLYFRYTVDSSCSSGCDFVAKEEKEVTAGDLYQETLALSPYSLNLIILKKKPKEPEKVTPPEITEQPAAVTPESGKEKPDESGSVGMQSNISESQETIPEPAVETAKEAMRDTKPKE